MKLAKRELGCNLFIPNYIAEFGVVWLTPR
jgi:hypothetical protein